MKQLIIVAFVSILLASCQKENITIGTNVSETFYLDNEGEAMHVLVEGNTSGKTFLIIVHGGPGVGSFIYNTDYISQNIEDKYAVVYLDQRNSGSSQGNSNRNELNLLQMTDDLKKVIQVIKGRYGENSSVFILGHSFGGLLVSSFMTNGNNQALVKGWILVDGSQNYPLNGTLTRQMLLNVGEQQIALNKHTTEWNTIITYCNSHTGNFTFEESSQLESYAADAETFIDEVHQFDYLAAIKGEIISDKLPLTSIIFNYLYSANASFNKDLAKTEFSSSLYKIVTPTLLIFGEYDFICPKELGYEIMNRISTTDKKMVISPISGHDLMFQDEALFSNEVDNFIEQHK